MYGSGGAGGVLEGLVRAVVIRESIGPGWPFLFAGRAGLFAHMTLRTSRLTLIPVTLAMVDAALAGNDALAATLGVTVPATWPHEFLDADAFSWFRARLTEPGYAEGWWMYFATHEGVDGPALIGSVGYKGPPDADATVEIGYGVVSDQRRRGYAAEMAMALTARAFAESDVRRVIAETMPELVGSIGVLERCRFVLVDGAAEPGAIRFELTRERFMSAGTTGAAQA